MPAFIHILRSGLSSIRWLFLLLITQPAFSQLYNFKHYGVADGLSKLQVSSIIQDRNGYMWIGTIGGGINRFDGKEFVHYSKKDGLNSNIIYSVIEDSRGGIWTSGDDGGASRFDGTRFKTWSVAEGLSSNRIYCIFEDNKQHIWFGTDKGITRYDGRKFTVFDVRNQDLLHNNIRCIIQDKDENLWFGCDKGLIRYDGHTFKNIPFTNASKRPIVMNMKTDRKGTIWLALFENGIGVLDGDQIKIVRDMQDPVFSVYADANNNIWFGTASGGAIYKKGETWTVYGEKEGFSNQVIRDIIKDREGNTWFATDEGIFKYDGGRFASFSDPGIRNTMVYCITEDGAGNTWYGTEQGLYNYHDGQLRRYTEKDGLAHNRIFGILKGDNNDIWLATYNGLSRFDGKHFTNYTTKDGIPNTIIMGICKDREGNIWLGTDEGACKWIPSLKQARVYKSGFETRSDRIRCIYRDRAGKLWFGTKAGGVTFFDGKKFSRYIRKDGLINNSVSVITEDRYGNMWFGTYEGLSVRRAGTNNFETITTKQGLDDDMVVSLIADSQGNLWIGTIKGLNKMNLDAFMNGQIIISHYGKEEGFGGLECTVNSTFIDRKGFIWFGTVKGAYRLDPAKDQPNMIPPFVYIKKIGLFFEDIPQAERNAGTLQKAGLSLPYDQNHLTFEYIGISFSAPGSVQYRYKLEGFDRDWSPAKKETFATYANIPPGRYTFQVKACNNNGIWSGIPAKYVFEIRPPFWQRWWFYLLCVLVSLATVFIAVRLLLNRINRKKIEEQRRLNQQIEQQKAITSAIIATQEQERKRIAEELHDGIGQVFSAIKLNLSCLEPELKRLDSDRRRNFETSVSLLDQATKELRAISHDMLPGHLNDLGLVVALEALCEKIQQTHVLECTFVSFGIEQRLSRPLELTLYRICQELLTNIVKHSKATESSVQLIRHESSIMLQVEDNGIGLPRQPSGGIGLENINSRLRLVNGIISIDSSRESGTSVVVEIPLNGIYDTSTDSGRSSDHPGRDQISS